MRNLAWDIRHVLRAFRRSPLLVLGFGLCLGLGVGVNAATVEVLDIALFRPPSHVRAPSEVARLQFRQVIPGVGEIDLPTTSYPIFHDLSERIEAFEGVAAYFRTGVSTGTGVEARPARATLVSQGFFSLLGTEPALGRFFDATEADPASPHRVVVLGFRYWQERFAGAQGVVGEDLTVGQDAFTIIGVAPDGFQGAEVSQTDLWLPLGVTSSFMGPDWYRSRGSMFLETIVRVPGTVSPIAAVAEATAALQHDASAEAGDTGPAVELAPLLRARGAHPGTRIEMAKWLASLSLVLLLIGCATAANLMIARTVRQQHELGIRAALGAGSGQLMTQVLLQGLTLGLVAAAVALAVLVWARRLVSSFLLPDTSTPSALGGDGRIVVFSLFVALLLGLLATVAPILSSRSRSLSAVIHAGDERGNPGAAVLKKSAIVVQIGLTLVLLSVAGMAVRNLTELLGQDPGIAMDELLLVTGDLERAGYSTVDVDRLFEHMRIRVEGLAGVEGAAVASGGPFGHGYGVGLSIPGVPDLPQLTIGSPTINAVTEGFFHTLGARLIEGRSLEGPVSPSGAPTSAVVNQTMAKLVWPDESAVGKCLEIGAPEAPACTPIVGIVRDFIRSSLQEERTMQVYVRLEERPERLTARSLFVRVDADDDAVPRLVAEAVRSVDPALPWIEVRHLRREIEPELRPWRFSASIFGFLGGFSLVLSVVGLYAVLAFNVAQRRHEIAVRVALGADRKRITGFVTGDGLRVGLLGVLLGVAGTWVLHRAADAFVFHGGEADPYLLAAASVLVLTAVAIASYLPARKAAALDPAHHLRAD